MNCAQCAFYRGDLKECRRFPPQVVTAKVFHDGTDYETQISVVPQPEPADLCGEYKPHPQKR